MTDLLVDRAMILLARLITGCRGRWLAPPPVGVPAVFFGNHTSHLDALAIWAALPGPIRRRCRPVAARDYWEATPLRRWLAERVLHALLIERHNVTRQNNPLPPMISALETGDSLILFPEGHRNEEAETGAFRSGLFHLARRRPDVPLYPVWLENLNRILPRGEYLFVPLIGSVIIGPPIHLESGENREVFLDRAKNAVAALRGRR